jgi:hypothetical protein
MSSAAGSLRCSTLLEGYTAFSARRYGWGAVVALSSPPSGAKDPGECRTDFGGWCNHPERPVYIPVRVV